jgi:hypothetical protein
MAIFDRPLLFPTGWAAQPSEDISRRMFFKGREAFFFFKGSETLSGHNLAFTCVSFRHFSPRITNTRSRQLPVLLIAGSRFSITNISANLKSKSERLQSFMQKIDNSGSLSCMSL